MEIWAWCSPCRRWFPCPDWFEQGQPAQPPCPTCGEPAKVIDNC